jgi:hypothetical protein
VPVYTTPEDTPGAASPLIIAESPTPVEIALPINVSPTRANVIHFTLGDVFL